MSDPAAFELLNNIAALQRRHSGGFILLSPDRSRAWPADQPENRVAIDPAALRELQANRLIMLEPYSETRPRGKQILGMTSAGWQLVPRG